MLIPTGWNGMDLLAVSPHREIASSGVASYVLTGLTVSTAYTIRVVSLRQNAPEGAASDSIVLTTMANAVVPAQPSAPILTVGDERLDVELDGAG